MEEQRPQAVAMRPPSSNASSKRRRLLAEQETRQTTKLPAARSRGVSSVFHRQSAERLSPGDESSMASHSSNSLNGGSVMSATQMWLNEKESEAEAARRNIELARLVKYELFAHVKFVCHHDQLVYSSNANSICQWTLNKMHMQKKHESTWWERYKKDIPTHLSTRRNNINTSMKRIFKGKCKTKVVKQ